jgi:hypothetical protein
MIYRFLAVKFRFPPEVVNAMTLPELFAYLRPDDEQISANRATAKAHAYANLDDGARFTLNLRFAQHYYAGLDLG